MESKRVGRLGRVKLDCVGDWEAEIRSSRYRTGELASARGVARSTLRRYMLRIRQVNPEVLAARLRMDDGLALMGAGLSVKETAARLGYTAQSHFCRHFREVYGVPPTEYKRRLKGNAAVQTR